MHVHRQFKPLTAASNRPITATSVNFLSFPPLAPGISTATCATEADGRRMHVNSNLAMDDWESDAFFLGVRSGAERRLLLIGGSYLRRKGEVVFDCFAKCNAVLTGDFRRREGGIRQAFIQAPPGSRVRFASGRAPHGVVANGKALPAASLVQENGFLVAAIPHLL